MSKEDIAMSNNKPLKEKISITIDGDLLAELRQMSDKYDRSLSQLINLILKHHVSNESDSPEKLRHLMVGK